MASFRDGVKLAFFPQECVFVCVSLHKKAKRSRILGKTIPAVGKVAATPTALARSETSDDNRLSGGDKVGRGVPGSPGGGVKLNTNERGRRRPMVPPTFLLGVGG